MASNDYDDVSSIDIDFGQTKHFLKVQWHSIKIDERSFLFKSLFESNSFEFLLFDMNEFSLFYSKNSQADIDVCFKVKKNGRRDFRFFKRLGNIANTRKLNSSGY